MQPPLSRNVMHARQSDSCTQLDIMHARLLLRTLASATPMISVADVLPTVQGSSADAQARSYKRPEILHTLHAGSKGTGSAVLQTQTQFLPLKWSPLIITYTLTIILHYL